MIVWPAKSPTERLDFSWRGPLDTGDAIDTFTPAHVSGDAALDGSGSVSGDLATVWITGGTADEIAYFNLTVVTDAGRTFRQTAILPIIDRAAAMLAGFRLRYPAFDDVDDGRIGYWLAQSATEVGSNWAEDMRSAGKYAWVGHKLVESGALASAVPAGLTSFKSGTFEAKVSDKIASLTGFDSTVYGREFLAMRRRLFSGPITAWEVPTSA